MTDQQGPGYSRPVPPGYPQQTPHGYPRQGYPQQPPQGYPQQTQGQQPSVRQPYVQQPYPQPYPQQAYPQQAYPPYPQQPQGRQRQVPTWVKIGVPAVVVVLVATGLVVLLNRGGHSSNSQAGGASTCNATDVGSNSLTDPRRYGVDIPACTPKQFATTVAGLALPATSAGLNKVDPLLLYWAVLKRQVTKPISSTVSVFYTDGTDYAQFPTGDAQLVQVDYAGHKFVAVRHTSVNIATGASVGGDSFITTCVDNMRHTWAPDVGWLPPNQADLANPKDNECNRLAGNKNIDAFSTDGIATGGLNSDKADKYLSYLAGVKGLISAAKPTMVQGSDGKSYIQLDMKLTPQNPHDPDDIDPTILMGGAFIEAAVAQTGIDQAKWPYVLTTAESQGLKVRYYIDPSTLLPAYSVVTDFGPFTADGKPYQPNKWTPDYGLYEYGYPTQLDTQLVTDTGTPSMPIANWPFPRYVAP